MYAAAARACAATSESPFTSTLVADCIEGGRFGTPPSFFGRFEVSSGVVDDDAPSPPSVISTSPSGGCLRFGFVVSSALSGVDELLAG